MIGKILYGIGKFFEIMSLISILGPIAFMFICLTVIGATPQVMLGFMILSAFGVMIALVSYWISEFFKSFSYEEKMY